MINHLKFKNSTRPILIPFSVFSSPLISLEAKGTYLVLLAYSEGCELEGIETIEELLSLPSFKELADHKFASTFIDEYGETIIELRD